MSLGARFGVAGLLLCAPLAHAEPADYVYTPAVEYGEKEIDFKYGSARRPDEPRESAGSLGFGYGATEWWFTELYLKYKKEDLDATKFDAVEWENKFQLTETGKYPLDLGFILEIERPQDRSEGWEVKWGPLLQAEAGKWQFNGNLLLQRNFRSESSDGLVFKYQWQAKYRWRQEIEFGLQGFGDLGAWNHWAPADEQEHRIGPAVFGKLPLGNHRALSYNAAWLFGASKAAPDNGLRLQIEYEF
jgi:hypothetical protein